MKSTLLVYVFPNPLNTYYVRVEHSVFLDAGSDLVLEGGLRVRVSKVLPAMANEQDIDAMNEKRLERNANPYYKWAPFNEGVGFETRMFFGLKTLKKLGIKL